MNRSFLISIWILLTVILNGCDFKDIDKRFFVIAIGLDSSTKFEDGYKVSLKLALPHSDPKIGTKNFTIVSEEGQSISEAIQVIESRVNKNLDFGQAKTIVIGDEAAQRDVRRTIDWFMRRQDIQQIAWITIGRPSAEKVLQQKPKTERLPSSVLLQFFGDTGTESPYIMYTYLFDFLRRLQEPGLSALLPIIEVSKDSSVHQIQKTSIFKNEKTVLTLGKDETKFLNIVARAYHKADLKVKKDKHYFILAMNGSSVSYSIHTENKKEPYINMYIKIRGIIKESSLPLQQVHLKEYEILTSKTVKKSVHSLLRKLQKKRVDPVGFGLRFRSRHIGDEKELYAGWKKLYPNVQFRVYVDTEIQGTGAIE